MSIFCTECLASHCIEQEGRGREKCADELFTLPLFLEQVSVAMKNEHP